MEYKRRKLSNMPWRWWWRRLACLDFPLPASKVLQAFRQRVDKDAHGCQSNWAREGDVMRSTDQPEYRYHRFIHSYRFVRLSEMRNTAHNNKTMALPISLKTNICSGQKQAGFARSTQKQIEKTKETNAGDAAQGVRFKV